MRRNEQTDQSCSTDISAHEEDATQIHDKNLCSHFWHISRAVNSLHLILALFDGRGPVISTPCLGYTRKRAIAAINQEYLLSCFGHYTVILFNLLLHSSTTNSRIERDFRLQVANAETRLMPPYQKVGSCQEVGEDFAEGDKMALGRVLHK